MAGMITDEIKAFIEANRPCMLVTCSKNGEPNASPKGSIGVLDENHLMFVEIASPKTRQNILENPRVSVAMLNSQERKGYQFKGSAEYVHEGPLYDNAVAALQKRMPGMPSPYGVVRIAVDQVFKY